MIIDFKVENFKSFKDATIFSMEVGEGLPDEVNTVTIFKGSKKEKNILKSAVLFGSNASGKSNFVNILSSLRCYLLEKGRGKFRNDDFRFLKDRKNSRIDINLYLDGKIYSCSVEINFPERKICSESLHIMEEDGEKKVYRRNADGRITYDKGVFSGYATTMDFIEESLNEYDSLLTRMKEYNAPPEIKKFIVYLENMIIIKDGEISTNLFGKMLYEKKGMKKSFLNYLRKLDIKVDDIEVKKERIFIPVDILGRVKSMKNFLPGTGENGFDVVYDINFIYKNRKEDSEYKLNLSEQSLGTRKILELCVPLYLALSQGSPLIIDELDGSLHYKIVYDIVKMFNSINENRKNAQLIFTTHNLLLLNSDIFREDQIWFTENEDIYGGTELYSLFDFNEGVDKENILRDYLNGFFGGIPDIRQKGEGRWLEDLETEK